MRHCAAVRMTSLVGKIHLEVRGQYGFLDGAPHLQAEHPDPTVPLSLSGSESRH
jgi:hypothetical protein